MDTFRSSVKVPSRASRKCAGSGLVLAIFGFLVLLPVALVGQLCTWCGVVLKYPIRRLGLWFVPNVVRLWYIHRLGRLHPWQCARSRVKHNLNAHSRSIRIDIVGDRDALPLAVHVIPQLHDNYAYLIVNKRPFDDDEDDPLPQSPFESRVRTRHYKCLIIDCSNAPEVCESMDSISAVHYRDGELRLEAILTTHHHWDHMGANDKLPLIFDSITRIVGGRRDRVLGATETVREGEVLELIGGARIMCHETPAHTLGSITYRLMTQDHCDCLFLGDTFFVGGCGANFEGDPLMMEDNFRRIYFSCHPQTLLFPGHEYSERILSTGLFPDRALALAKVDTYRFQALARQFARVAHLRSLPHPAPTAPVPLWQEVEYNPQFDSVIRATRLLMAAVYLSRHKPPPEKGEEEETRMQPRIAVSEAGRFMLVEPPWIIPSANIHSAAMGLLPDGSYVDSLMGPSVTKGFELTFDNRRIPHNINDISEALLPFIVTSEGEELVSLTILEKCVLYPMGTGYPGLSDEEFQRFRQFMEGLRMVDLESSERSNSEHAVSIAGEDIATTGRVLDLFVRTTTREEETRYVRFDMLLAFVYNSLRPTLIHANRVYGKKFKDPPELVSAMAQAMGVLQASEKPLEETKLPEMEHHSAVPGGSFLSVRRSTAPDVTAFRFHDFTSCPLCNARPVTVKQPKALFHLCSEGVAAGKCDNVLRRKPTTLSLLRGAPGGSDDPVLES